MKITELINHPKSRYIVITFIVSGIGFLKSFILLKILNLEHLGIIALAQTCVTTISLLQIGVVTGGYRLFSYKQGSLLKKINAAVLMFFLLISPIILFIGGVIACFINVGINFWLMLLFITIGILSLYSNWVVCKLLGTKNLIVLNKAQLFSAIFSLLLAVLAKWYGFSFVIYSLILQPIIIILYAYKTAPSLIPSFDFSAFRKIIKIIIHLGFVPYLTSALTFFNSQLGRWLIAFSLGTVFLGKTFLVTLFIALVSVFPTAISNLFFPVIIEKYEMNMREDLKSILKSQVLILGVYFIIITGVTLAFGSFLIKIFLPRHIESVSLIYAIIPSVIFLNLSSPAIILFNAVKKFNFILAGGLISILTYSLLLGIYFLYFKPQLISFFIIESMSAFVFFVYNCFYFFKTKKAINL